jgi:hypothetical protein
MVLKAPCWTQRDQAPIFRYFDLRVPRLQKTEIDISVLYKLLILRYSVIATQNALRKIVKKTAYLLS